MLSTKKSWNINMWSIIAQRWSWCWFISEQLKLITDDNKLRSHRNHLSDVLSSESKSKKSKTFNSPELLEFHKFHSVLSTRKSENQGIASLPKRQVDWNVQSMNDLETVYQERLNIFKARICNQSLPGFTADVCQITVTSSDPFIQIFLRPTPGPKVA